MNPEKTLATGPELSGVTLPASDARSASDIAPVSPPAPISPQAQGESDRAFEAFRAYLELGPQRRYAAVGRKVGASLRTVRRWASDFDWKGRISTYTAQCADRYTQFESGMQQ